MDVLEDLSVIVISYTIRSVLEEVGGESGLESRLHRAVTGRKRNDAV